MLLTKPLLGRACQQACPQLWPPLPTSLALSLLEQASQVHCRRALLYQVGQCRSRRWPPLTPLLGRPHTVLRHKRYTVPEPRHSRSSLLSQDPMLLSHNPWGPYHHHSMSPCHSRHTMYRHTHPTSHPPNFHTWLTARLASSHSCSHSHHMAFSLRHSTPHLPCLSSGML